MLQIIATVAAMAAAPLDMPVDTASAAPSMAPTSTQTGAPSQTSPAGGDVPPQSQSNPVLTGDAALQDHPQNRELPYDEDYSSLRNQPRSSLWEKLKYIPLGNATFLSIGGEARTRFEVRDGQRFGLGPQDGNGDLELRFRAWADLHVGDHLRGFFELKSGLQEGYDVPQTVSDRKDIDVGQAFVELRTPIGDDGSVKLRVGRQEIGIGAYRLFDMRDGLNVRRSLDAARLLFAKGAWNGELLGGYAQNETLTEFDNSTNYGFSFYGARLARTAQFGPLASTIEGLWIHSDRAVAVYDAGSAAEHRNTFSLRINGGTPNVEYDLEGTVQNGRWGAQIVSANYISANVAYIFDGAWKPKLGLHYERGSGDRNRNDNHMNTYFSLFARPTTLDGELNRANIVAFGPSLTLTPTRKLTLDATVNDLLRTSVNDGIYLGSGVLLRGALEGTSQQVGVRTTVGSKYIVSSFITVGTYFNHVQAGRFLRQSGNSSSLNYGAAFVTFRF